MKWRHRLAALISGGLWPNIPPTCQKEFEFWPAVASAKRVFGESDEATDAELPGSQTRFQEAFRTSKVLSPLLPQADEFFRRYRTFLQKGWDKEHF